MAEKATTTTPDPELSTPIPVAPAIPSGEGVRGEVAGCPTGLDSPPQVQQPQQPGGGGAPGTGQVPPSPGEGGTEEQQRRSGRDD
jgi:hypothetical protein